MNRVISAISKSSNPLRSIGVVISNSDGNSPQILHYSFILTQDGLQKKNFVLHGQYCIVDSLEGFVLGVIEQIRVDNQYFTNHQTVKSFDIAQVDLQAFFPSDQWECHIAEVKVLGVIKSDVIFSEDILPDSFERIDKVGFPVKPGNRVYLMHESYLQHFLGVNETGLNIGHLKNYQMDVHLDVNRLFNKHLAILAQSGAGKSYLLSVLVEELLLRSNEQGTPALVLIDVHGEYRFLKAKLADDLKESPSLNESIRSIQNKIQLFNASFLQIGVPDLNAYDFQRYQPGISVPQLRELRKAITFCKKKYIYRRESTTDTLSDDMPKGYDISDIIEVLVGDVDINSKTRDTLIGWLEDLNHLGIFAKYKSPGLDELVRVGELSIIDLSSMISMRKKQILVHYFSSTLFQARRNNFISPFILFLEEAHNFLPETGSKFAVAKSILETIAREGRKFYAQLVLVSQRPVHLSTTALSQCNTQIIMRVTNPYDLNHIKSTSEAITKEALGMISTLPTGNALVMGAALNFPIFLAVRKRLLPNRQNEECLSSVSKRFIKKDLQHALEDLKSTRITDHFIAEKLVKSSTNE
ncbi:hypothetical protein NEF87_004008 [Candidatus Lokiarchaeum ossiferum]|uniref:Helicase HerA central domain-containing protein n=1 Tax=Candidatus Lokiarchaeum ossiferum TaxID=2951803 RepID=A0ABY6HW28_9ARCH|nr:hypothetical protein NEF87_004008 [Candidatus Lokiarchaeum sp. B-35]